MKKRLITILMSTVFAVALTSNANAGQPSVYIISPAQGQVVSSPVQVRFGLRGMGVAPAGVDKDRTGHHHLLIDVDVLPNLTIGVCPNIAFSLSGVIKFFLFQSVGKNPGLIAFTLTPFVPHSRPKFCVKFLIPALATE